MDFANSLCRGLWTWTLKLRTFSKEICTPQSPVLLQAESPNFSTQMRFTAGKSLPAKEPPRAHSNVMHSLPMSVCLVTNQTSLTSWRMSGSSQSHLTLDPPVDVRRRRHIDSQAREVHCEARSQVDSFHHLSLVLLDIERHGYKPTSFPYGASAELIPSLTMDAHSPFNSEGFRHA